MARWAGFDDQQWSIVTSLTGALTVAVVGFVVPTWYRAHVAEAKAGTLSAQASVVTGTGNSWSA